MTTLLVISPDYASHYGPLAVIARAVQHSGRRVVIATGHSLRSRVEAEGFEWRELNLAASSNSGIVDIDPSIKRFLAATKKGALDTIRYQAMQRQIDLMWEPEQVVCAITSLYRDIAPDEVLVDHVSFASTLAMYAIAESFITLVPGHPSQLPLGDERYGIPAQWPACLRPDPEELSEVEKLADTVSAAFTDRWNSVLASVAPERPLIENAFTVHGRRVLYNSVSSYHHPLRSVDLPADHRFVGPLVREEVLPESLTPWCLKKDDRPQIYVALGTFLSHRSDVLIRIAQALREINVRAAIAIGSMQKDQLGSVPDDWIIARELPQVAMLKYSDLAIHHGGNNSVQECLGVGVRQLVLPFSTDQFANAADLERTEVATILDPNEMNTGQVVEAVLTLLDMPLRNRQTPISNDSVIQALFDNV
ncbi:MAG: zeaxanthin glucosyltransferase [Oceanospirillaceae bacterium]|jgi:zeaxanthin glucosyltransferase